MDKRIGIVTGGGDCPGLNAVIRAVAKAANRRGWEAIGIVNGFEGLLEPRQTVPLDYRALDGLLVRGGTILGTANRGRFSAKTGFGTERRLPAELLDATRHGVQALGLDALVAIGGDGSLAIAQQMHERGIPVVGVPKTIDNDVSGTVLTFGFASAIDCVTLAIDRLHTTAESHGRVNVLTARLLREIHRRGKKLFIWTVNDEQDMRRLLAMGVDGLVTDRPAVLLELLRNFPPPVGPV